MSEARESDPSSAEIDAGAESSGPRRIPPMSARMLIPRDADAPSHDAERPDPRLMETLDAEEPASSTRAGADSSRFCATRLPVVDPKSYQVTGEVAQGGIGRILRARSVSLDRTVALKRLLGPGKTAEERFVREALVTARLQHPSIVPIYEAGRFPTGEPFYTMRLVSGRDLAGLIDETSSLEQRLALLRHVLAAADAVAYAHSERIIHRDLKPANILVGDFGETVVIDWGLAKDLVADEREERLSDESAARRTLGGAGAPAGLTVTGAIMGTPAYMPPEQALGQVVDERADVYALGAILYHLLSGVSPYEGKTSIDILRRVIAGPPIPLAQVQKGLSSELLAIVNKAMARAPEARYATARELAEDLRRFETGQIVGAHQYSSLQLFSRFLRRYKAPLAVAAVALCAVALAIAVGMRRTIAERNRAEARQREAEAAQREAARRADQLTLVQARAAASQDPNKSLGWLKSLSPSFSRLSAARVIAANARAHGVARVLRGHTALINMVAYSPDGSRLASVSDDHTVRIWDLARGASRVFEGHQDEVWRISFLRGGAELLTTGKDKTARLWDVATGQGRIIAEHTMWIHSEFHPNDGENIYTLSGEGTLRRWNRQRGQGQLVRAGDGEINIVDFSPDGKWMGLVAYMRGAVKLVHVESGERRELSSDDVWQRPSSLTGEPFAIQFSPDSRLLALRSPEGAVRVWDVASGARRKLLDGASAARASFISPFGLLTFSPDGTRLAVAGEDNAAHVFELDTGKERVFEGHEGRISRLVFSPDGAQLAAGGYDRQVWVWDIATGQGRLFHGNDDASIGLAFSPDGRFIASGGADNTVRIFPLQGDASRVLPGHEAGVRIVRFSPDGEVLASGSADGTIRIWDRAGQSPPTSLFAHERGVHDLAFSPDGARIASGGADAKLRIWSRFGDAIRVIEGYRANRFPTLSFSPDGARIAFSNPDHTLRLVDVDTGEERRFEGHRSSIESIAFSPDGKRLSSVSSDKTIRVWDLASGQSQVLTGHEEGVLVSAFTPDGRYLLSGSADHTLGLWDLETGEHRRVNASGNGVHQIAFTPDGRVAVTANRGETMIRTWEVPSLRELHPLRGHTGEITRFALSPEGTRVASASIDGTVRLWDLASGEGRALTGHADPVYDVAFSPDGQLCASAGKDGTVRLWADDLPLEPVALRRWIQASTPDSMSVHELGLEEDPAAAAEVAPLGAGGER